jgi:hypothetical protein
MVVKNDDFCLPDFRVNKHSIKDRTINNLRHRSPPMKSWLGAQMRLTPNRIETAVFMLREAIQMPK